MPDIFPVTPMIIPDSADIKWKMSLAQSTGMIMADDLYSLELFCLRKTGNHIISCLKKVPDE